MLDQRDDHSAHARLASQSKQQRTVCRRGRQTVLLCFMALFLLAQGATVGCRKREGIKFRPSDLLSVPDAIGDSLRMLYTKDGRCEMEIRAATMNVYSKEDKDYDEFPKGIVVQAYDSAGAPSTMIRAKYALYLRKKRLWDARHDVVAVNEQGDSIQTERMFWDEEKKLIYSDDNVRIRTADALLFGKGFESDERFNNWEIRYPKGVMTVRDTP